jgi:hypothetical protein
MNSKTARTPTRLTTIIIKVSLFNSQIYIRLLADNNRDTNLALHYQAPEHKLGLNYLTRWLLNRQKHLALDQANT